MHGVCVVEAGGALDTKPLKVKVSVQKLGRWWRWLPRPSYKKVAAFHFHWEEIFHTRKTYTSKQADMNMARLLKAKSRSGDALVKMAMTHSYGKVVAITTVTDFLRRLGKGQPDGFVFQLSMANKNTKAPEEQHTQDKSESMEGQGKVEAEAPWVGKTCKCPHCVLPFWELLRAWEPLPVKPPTAMDTYVDILATECTVLKKEANVMLEEKRSCASELAALKAEMDRMERELDRAEASWANAVMEESEEQTSVQLEGTEEDYFGYRNEELWTELLDNVSDEEENKTLEEHLILDETEEEWNMKECEEKEGSDGGNQAESEEQSEEQVGKQSNPSRLRTLLRCMLVSSNTASWIVRRLLSLLLIFTCLLLSFALLLHFTLLSLAAAAS